MVSTAAAGSGHATTNAPTGGADPMTIAPPPRAGRTSVRFALVDALNAEWQAMADDHRLAEYGRAELVRWAADHPALVGCASPADVLTAIGDDPDGVLAALITVHQGTAGPRLPGCRGRQRPVSGTGRELAGRIVLQTMLGKVVTMAQRDRCHAVEDYVGQLWARIGSYPLARRPRRIAANLALDTLKAVTRDSHGDGTGRRAGRTVPVTAEELERAGLAASPPGDGVQDLNAHRVLRVARHLELIDEPTRRLLAAVYLDGLTSAEAAARFGLSATTVRFRCAGRSGRWRPTRR